MLIRYSSYGDGPRDPRTGASAGETALGPLGLLGLFEQQWGLQRPEATQALRIGQYMECLKAHLDGVPFFLASFEADPWETARLVLSWRDELILGGWEGQPLFDGSRIATLARVEEMAMKVLGSGYADRMRAVLSAVREGKGSIEWLRAIQLVEPRADLEPWWCQLFDGLEQLGVRISETVEVNQRAAGDLGEAQALLAGVNLSTAYRGDHSLTLLWAENEAELAEVLAAWLQAGDNSEAQILAESRSELLDRTLKDAGLPGLGVENPSPHRTLLQVIPAAWEMFWSPPNIHAYLQWLSLPLSPIPRHLRSRLTDALTDMPGIGSPKWMAALDDSRQYQIEHIAERYPPKEHQKRMTEWDSLVTFWFAHDHYDPTIGLPKALAVEMFFRIQTWLVGLASQRPDPIIHQAISAAAEMAKVVSQGSADAIPEPLLSRMWESVIGAGVIRSDVPEEAAPWRLARHPGMVIDPVPTLVWWRFEDPRHGRSASFWTMAERDALGALGMKLDDPAARLRREARAWSLPILAAQSRVLLLSLREVAGEAASLHPLWDALLAGGSTPRQEDARILFQQGEMDLAGRHVQLERIPVRHLAAPRRHWPLAPGLVPPRVVESATSLESLFSCSLQWVLRYGLHTRSLDVIRLPEVNQMVGRLVHAIVSEMLEEKRDWDPREAGGVALKRFERLVPERAAPLLHPAQGLRYIQVRRDVGSAVESLFSQLQQHGLSVVETEIKKSRDWRDGQRIEGTLDLELVDGAGHPVVWDLKWSRSSHYATTIEENQDVQLTTYAWLLGADETRSAYMLLRNGRVVWTPSNTRLDWERVETSYDYYLESLKTGAEATGIDAPDVLSPTGVISRTPPCDFCPYTHLCGRKHAQ